MTAHHIPDLIQQAQAELLRAAERERLAADAVRCRPRHWPRRGALPRDCHR